ncbi:YopX family protein [Lysinibacillus sp. FSL W8-0992]|uniref:YopX family protein n=1 Tax=Lysinibacillus sp. FSL W8-0992 TaxID=2954643 RepID=UPI0030F5D9D4
MREIKFRAWEKNLKEIIHVNDINFKNNQINTNGPWRTFNEIELMQYTGLKDANGVEIFEGDILRAPLEGARNFAVRYDDSKCKFISVTVIEDGVEWFMDVSRRHHVIGNIYENPELLGGASE